jgi:hypothetical protein
MFLKTWYKVLAWIMATFYFFILMGVNVSMFSPGPSEAQAMKWMSGMMQAMHTSLIGWTMENHELLNQLLLSTGSLVLPSILTGLVLGIILKLRGQKGIG